MDSASTSMLTCLLVVTTVFEGIGGNLALGKYATQKSTARHWDGYSKNYYYNIAGRGVDGLVHTNDPEDGCTSTADHADTDAWWMVDLGRVYVISNITVYNRRGGYHRLRDFWIRVGNSSDITQHDDCTYKSGWIGPGESETFMCDRTLSGRWVSIQRTNDLLEDWLSGNGFLHLCEVVVYGYAYTATTTDVTPTDGRSTASVTFDTRKSTSLGPEILQEKACGWPVSAVATSVVLGILLLIVLAVSLCASSQKSDNDPVSTGSISMTGLGHGDDYEPVQAAGTQIHSAGNYERVDPVHDQSPVEEEKKYEALNNGQMTSQEPQAYEDLRQS